VNEVVLYGCFDLRYVIVTHSGMVNIKIIDVQKPASLKVKKVGKVT
jgi:hypothetical protein